MQKSYPRWPALGALAIVVFGLLLWALVTSVPGAGSNTGRFSEQFVLAANNAQDVEAAISPEALGRLSWGAVIAGSLVAIILQFMFNMIGLAVGAMAVDPHDPKDSAEPKTLGMGALAWMGLSALIALFLGGLVAARFAGVPNDTDGFLHGIMVWTVTSLITVVLLFTAAGRLLSGMASLLADALRLAGNIGEAAARGTAAVAGGAATVAGGAAGVAADAAKTAASAAGSAARGTADAAKRVAGDGESGPEMSGAMRKLDDVRERIMAEAMQALRQAGMSPERIEAEARAAAQDVKQTAQRAAQNPNEADQQFSAALDRLVGRGEAMATDVDRQSMVNVLMTRGNMDEARARRNVQEWENTYRQARQEVDRVREEARQRAGQMRAQVEDKLEDAQAQARSMVREARQEAERRVEEVKDEVEYQAREAADAARKALAGIAAAIVVTLIISGVAAGIGGVLGTPSVDDVPTVEVDTVPGSGT